ncbi:hypothetical protein GCM10023178_35480 [Actinomadura luteofluorescens]
MSEPGHRGEPDRASPLPGPPPSFGASSSPVRWEEEAADPLVVWVRWHLVELAGVGAPLGLAVTVSWWFAVLAAGAASAWAAQEARQAHRHRRLNTAATTAIDASEESE